MNCPSRPDNSNGREGWNQSPNQHSGTTREDFNGMANARVLRRIETHNPVSLKSNDEVPDSERQRKNSAATIKLTMTQASQSVEKGDVKSNIFHCDGPNDEKSGSRPSSFFSKARNLLMTFGKFVGPGFMVRTPLRARKTMFSVKHKGSVKCMRLTYSRYPLHTSILEIIQPISQQVLTISFSSCSLSCYRISLPSFFSLSVSS